MFDVTMRSYNAAEICELVGLYLLNQLSTVIDKSSVGLYRDDGLAAINNENGPKLHRISKDIIALFKKEGLSITIETNLIETDFLDVTFNPETKKYFPFRKAYDTPLFINAFSKHPSTIIKQLPKMISNWISDLSCNKEEFDKVKSVYKSALKDSGHFHQCLTIIAILKTLEEIETARLYGSTHRIAKMWKQILVNCSSSL